MKHPPYHLRPNKAVDRLTLIDAIKRLGKLNDLSEYTYYGFGGPYLEDFRLMYEFYPEVKLISIEGDEETYKRQKFHLPCRVFHLKLKYTTFKSFLAQYEANDKKSIFWLDYTGLEYGLLDDFMSLLGKVAANSIIKVTLRAEPRDYIDKQDEFRRKFDDLMPDPSADPPLALVDFAYLVQEMIQIAAQKTLSGEMPLMFLPLSSFYYTDGTGMLTLTGMVCFRAEQNGIKKSFKDWEFANLEWRKPKAIDVPMLSTKERLQLQRLLPLSANAGKILRKSLGYLIDEDIRKTDIKLRQYADFHRYFPYFMKATP